MATKVDKEGSTIKYPLQVCNLCTRELEKPKLLPCQHTFCTQCLVQYHDGNEEGKPFCCPTCQFVVGLKDTIESIPDNYVYDILKEIDEDVFEQNLECIPCSQGKKSTTATHECQDCGDTLCQHCNEWHCRFTSTMHHVTVLLNDIQDGNPKEGSVKRKVMYCDLHSKDDHKIPLSTYCNTCRCLVCLGCVQGDHKGHDFIKKQTVRQRHQKINEEKFANLQKSKRDQNKRVEKIQEAITDTKQTWIKQEANIYDTANELYAMVEKKKDEKLTKLKSHYEKELQHLNNLLEEEKNKQSSLQATVTFTKIFLEKSSDSDFLCHEDDVESRVELSQRGKSRGFTRNRLSIEKPLKSITVAIHNAFGRAIIQENIVPYKYKIGNVKECFRKITEMDCIYGLALNANSIDELFVAGSKKDGGILVLDKCANYCRVIHCQNANDSHHIYFANSQLFLTINKKGERKVVILDLDGKVKRSIMLPDDDQEMCFGLGIVVDDSNTIFVSSYGTDRIYRVRPDEESFSTFISKEVKKSVGSSYLSMTPSGELVVSNEYPCNIQIYSKDGELQWQYDGKKKNNALKHPNGVCCDEDGYIYVIDADNCRIQVIHDRKWVGNIPIDKEVEKAGYIPLIITPDRELIYGYGNNIVKIVFWKF